MPRKGEARNVRSHVVWAGCDSQTVPVTEGTSLRSRVPQKCAPCHARTELPPEVAGVQGS
jgi:hypothetical protein